MDVAITREASEIVEGTEFDLLCQWCAGVLDNPAFWKKVGYLPHHDIYSLSRSAAASCHRCSLILGQIHPNNVIHLIREIDEGATVPSEQLGVQTRYSLSLYVAVRSSSLPQPLNDWKMSPGWTDIAELAIRPSHSDYSTLFRAKSGSNSPDQTIALIKDWLAQCYTTHVECSMIQTVAATRVLLPKRLLDLRFVAEKGCIGLIESQSLPKNARYATLSHCWGGRCEIALTIDRWAQFEDGVAVDSLPQTFRDAVHVAIQLDVRYLWIDALCIVQDSVNDSEWSQEASIMGDIYANSYITLAATTSENSQGGLLSSRSPLSVWPCRVTSAQKLFGGGKFLIRPRGWASESDMKRLGDRAWAFQEWLLSKRLVHFSKDQVRWECYCLAASEIYPNGLDDDDAEYYGLPAKSIMVDMWRDPEKSHHFWERIREEYSKKLLTKFSDRLAAFSGITRMVHQLLKLPTSDYLAGLWRPSLLQELLWERYWYDEQPFKQETYIAPTWSWMSLNGRFYAPKSAAQFEGCGRYVDVVRAEVSPIHDTFGPVKSGRLVLRSSVSCVKIESSPSGKDSSHRPIRLRKHDLPLSMAIPFNRWCRVALDHHLSDTAPQCSFDFDFMPIASHVGRKPWEAWVKGLLLEQTQNLPGQYYRIGILELAVLGSLQQAALLSVLESNNNCDANTYLDYGDSNTRAIEII